MKNMKKIVAVILSFAMALAILVPSATEVQAAAKATVTKAVHLYVGEVKDDAIDINFAEKGDNIGNLKTSSKNISAKIVKINRNNVPADCTAQIGLYANKEGVYTVSFDIMDSDDEKVSSHSVKVYANTDIAIKSSTFAGERMNYKVTDKEKGKLSVKMNKGYTLKKIVVETYDENGEQKSKTVKNNSTIDLGRYAYFSESGEADEEGYYRMDTSFMAVTRIWIYYTDKFTKSEASEIYYIYRLAI